MAGERDAYSWSNAWFRRSVLSLALLAIASLLVGFVWLPSVHPDYTAGGLWAAVCRAAGVPQRWGGATPAVERPPPTNVVLDRTMTHPPAKDAVGRGATLALNCTMCHGARGISVSDAPNLAGQYPEVIVKQLRDYKSGKRVNATMQAMVTPLSDRDITDLAAYFAYLPKARRAPTTYDEPLPALVRNGDPMRNIGPCIACHGGIDQKLGAPWIEGMPLQYLVAQLEAFQRGERHNDSFAQMRNMARSMTPQEIDTVARFYARKAAEGEVGGTSADAPASGGG